MKIRHYLGVEGHEFIPDNDEEIEFLATEDKDDLEDSLSIIIPHIVYET